MLDDKKINITFGIKEIKTLKFTINNVPEAYKIPKEKFQFQILPASFFSYTEKIIGFDVIVNIFFDDNDRKIICELISRITFDIKNLHDFVSIKNQKAPQLPESLMQTLLSISLSTTRGILFSKTEGSVLSGVNMPVLNPSNFQQVKRETKKEK